MVAMTLLLTLSQGALPDVKAAAESYPEASILFSQYCVSCHGEKGKGDGILASKLETIPADLSNLWRWKPKNFIARTIRNGRGEDMPAWGKVLNEDEIYSLVHFLKAL